MLAEAVLEPCAKVHCAGRILLSSAGGLEDRQTQPLGPGVRARVGGAGSGMPGAEEMVVVSSNESGVPRPHERLGGGRPDLAIEGGTAAVVEISARRHSGTGTDHPPMITGDDRSESECVDGAMSSVFLSGEPQAVALLADDRFALLIGMLLDQQVTMESAFAGPAKLAERLGRLDVDEIAEMNPDDFLDAFAASPAVHRFPKSMAARVQKLAAAIVDDYDGQPEAIWTRDDPSGAEVLKRLKKLPGFGD